MPSGYSYLYSGTEGAKRHGEQLNEMFTNIIRWGQDRGIDDPKAQLNKVLEELGEIAHEINRNHYDVEALEQPEPLVDAFGDTFVTLIILCDILNIDPLETLEHAWEEIKDRTGHLEEGSWVKDEH